MTLLDSVGLPLDPLGLCRPTHDRGQQINRSDISAAQACDVEPQVSWLALLVPSQFVATIICVAGLITALVSVRRLRRLITVSIRHQQF